MTAGGAGRGGPNDPMRAGAQMWEAGYRALQESWTQTQEFWNTMARGWGEVTGTWMNQATRTGEEGTILRELSEAAFEVAQAWMRLPLVMIGGARPEELQQALVRLSQAQGRAYQMWMDSVARMGGATARAADRAAAEASESQRQR